MIDILLGLLSNLVATYLFLSKSRFARALKTGLLLVAACFMVFVYALVATNFDYRDSESWVPIIGVLFIVVVTLILWTILRPLLVYLTGSRPD